MSQAAMDLVQVLDDPTLHAPMRSGCTMCDSQMYNSAAYIIVTVSPVALGLTYSCRTQGLVRGLAVQLYTAVALPLATS